MVELMTPTRGFEIRTIRTGEQLSWSGYGLEVLDGGVRGSQNQLVLGIANSDGGDLAYKDQASLLCWPGNKLISRFDYVRLQTPDFVAVPGTDTVKCKINTHRNGVFTDAQRPGLTTKRNLARGTQGVIAAGQTQLLYRSNDLAAAIYRDDYYTDSRETDLGFFDGWIAGDATFDVFIFAARQQDGTTNTPMRPIAWATAQDRSTGYPGTGFGGAAVHTAGWSYNFSWGGTGKTSTVNVPIAIPGGAWEIHVSNTSAGGLNVEYLIGARGAM